MFVVNRAVEICCARDWAARDLPFFSRNLPIPIYCRLTYVTLFMTSAIKSSSKYAEVVNFCTIRQERFEKRWTITRNKKYSFKTKQCIFWERKKNDLTFVSNFFFEPRTCWFLFIGIQNRYLLVCSVWCVTVISKCRAIAGDDSHASLLFLAIFTPTLTCIELVLDHQTNLGLFLNKITNYI